MVNSQSSTYLVTGYSWSLPVSWSSSLSSLWSTTTLLVLLLPDLLFLQESPMTSISLRIKATVLTMAHKALCVCLQLPLCLTTFVLLLFLSLPSLLPYWHFSASLSGQDILLPQSFSTGCSFLWNIYMNCSVIPFRFLFMCCCICICIWCCICETPAPSMLLVMPYFFTLGLTTIWHYIFTFFFF